MLKSNAPLLVHELQDLSRCCKHGATQVIQEDLQGPTSHVDCPLLAGPRRLSKRTYYIAGDFKSSCAQQPTHSAQGFRMPNKIFADMKQAPLSTLPCMRECRRKCSHSGLGIATRHARGRRRCRLPASPADSLRRSKGGFTFTRRNVSHPGVVFLLLSLTA